MGKHQLFKDIPPMELVLQVLQSFGFENLEDKRCICKKYFKKMNVLEKIDKLIPELKKYYLPCKAKTYLILINNNSVLTILRQILRPYNYIIVSREKYINGEKLINYNIINKNKIEYKPIVPEDTKSAVVDFS